MVRAYSPASSARRPNAALLYQPALPVLFSDGALSKETPSVPEPHPKAEVIRDASP